MDSQGIQFSFSDDDELMILQRAFEAACRQLSAQDNRPTLRVLISNVKVLRQEDDVIKLGVLNEFDQKWLGTRYTGKLSSLISEFLGKSVKVEFVVERSAKDVLPAEMPYAEAPTLVANEHLIALPPLKLVERYTFENFIVGRNNRLAHAGAKAVTDSPGTKYNPLFIFGGPGLGKTHLLHAIAHAVLAKNANSRICYMTADEFTEQYIHAIKEQTVDRYRKMIRSVDLWLIDDIQFIAGKERTQEEFFHTFNVLYQTGKQIVLCSDRPPRDLFLTDDRLRTRFEQGLIADISAPDLETRVAILSGKADENDFTLPNDVAYFIADKIQSNIRSLEGALTRLMAHVSLNGQSCDLGLAAGILESFYIEPLSTDKMLTIEAIVKACCVEFGLTPEELRSSSRKANLANARHIAIYLSREHTKLSWKSVGLFFGGKDHTTAMHAHKKIASKLTEDPNLEKLLRKLVRHASRSLN